MISQRTGVAWKDGYYVTWYEGKRYVHTTIFDTEEEAKATAKRLSDPSWPFGDFTCFVSLNMPVFERRDGVKILSTWKQGKES